jgi:MarR family transcriptional regulator, organic hydroperoxide resistance regulator
MDNPKSLQTTHPLEVYLLNALHRSNRQATIFVDELIREFGLCTADGHLLAYLGVLGPSSVAELVRIFGYHKSTMSSILNKLEKRGHLRRVINDKDRRSFLVELTAEGRRVSDLARARVKGLDTAILEQVTATDMRGFQRVIDAVAMITGVEIHGERRSRKSAGRRSQRRK